MIFGICGRQENAKALKCTVVASEGIAQIEQLLNSPIQFIDMMKLINSIRNLQIEAIQVQFGGDI